MYAKLNMPFALRGYLGTPHVLVNMQTGNSDFLNLEGYQALSYCNGMIDLDAVFLSATQKQLILDAEKSGVITCAQTPLGPLDALQQYRSANNKYLKSVHWSVTGRCNLRCRHCYMSAPDYKYHDLSTEECLNIVRQFQEAGVLTVTITGGEPFVRPDLFQILEAILQAGIGIAQIYTNGLLLNDGILEWFLQRGIKPEFVLSYDCVGCHDWMRGVDHVEGPTLDAIRLLKSKGFSVMIETALCARNFGALLETYELLKSLDVDYWKASQVFEAGKWAETGEGQMALEPLYEGYLSLIRRYAEDGAPMSMQLDGFFLCTKGKLEEYTSLFQRKCSEKTAAKISSCLTCRVHPYLLPHGALLPCASMTDSSIEGEMPNLRETTLSEVYRNPENPFFQLSNIRIADVIAHNPECQSCAYRYECGGGCRAMSLLAGNGVMGYSPTLCAFFKQGYRDRIREAVEQGKKNCRNSPR